MQKIKISFAILFLLCLSGCGLPQSKNTSNSNLGTSSFIDFQPKDEVQLENVTLTETGEDLINGAYYTDGNGISFVAIEAILSDGKKISTKFDGNIASYDLSCGYLISVDKQCIILQTHFPSNYGATDIHVLTVENDQYAGPYFEEILTIIDGYCETDTPPEVNLFANSVYRIPNPLYTTETVGRVNKYLCSITTGNEIVNVPENDLQGLKVNIHSFDQNLYAIITWDGSKWISNIYAE